MGTPLAQLPINLQQRFQDFLKSYLQQRKQTLTSGQASPQGQQLPPGLNSPFVPPQGGGAPQTAQDSSGMGVPQMGSTIPSTNIKFPKSIGVGDLPTPMAAPANSPMEQSSSDMIRIIGAYQQKHQQREQAEAANLAQNLMSAIHNKDWVTANEILSDKKAQKTLKKVFPGWLTPAGKQQKTQKPQSPEVAAFQQGVQKFQQQLQQYQQKQQGQQGQQTQQPQQDLSQIQGYQLPKAGPEQQTQAMQTEAMRQLYTQHPEQALAVTPQQALQVKAKLGELQISGVFARMLASNEMRLQEMEQQQDSELKRALAVAGINTETRLAVAKLQATNQRAMLERKAQIAQSIIHGKPDNEQKVQLSVLQTQLKSAQTLLMNDNDIAAKVASTNPVLAQQYRDKATRKQQLVDSINQQLDDFKTLSNSTVQQALQDLLGPE